MENNKQIIQYGIVIVIAIIFFYFVYSNIAISNPVNVVSVATSVVSGNLPNIGEKFLSQQIVDGAALIRSDEQIQLTIYYPLALVVE